MTDFIKFGRAHGLEINPAKLHVSQKIRRCGTTEKPKSDNGAYFFDGQRGWVCNWSDGARVEWWNDPHAKPWTEADKAEWKAKRQEERRKQELAYQRAALEATEMIRRARSDTHAYLHRKGFPDERGLILDGVDLWIGKELQRLDNVLLIPMKNPITGQLQGVQQIAWDESSRKFVKKMQTGMRAKGATFRMGPMRATETYLCEGYATGLSILAALRSIGSQAAVLVCFSASNLEHVANMVAGRRFVCADNDVSKTGQEAAEATGLPWCMPDTEGQDFNDLHAQSGLFAVAKQLMEVRLKQEVSTT